MDKTITRAEAERLTAENKALRTIIERLAHRDWIIDSWHEPDLGFHWRVNTRDEPSRSKKSTTYTGTTYTGSNPIEAGLACFKAAGLLPDEEGPDGR